MTALFKTYSIPALLLCSIVFGGIFGSVMGKQILFLKPLGDIFLRLIFTAVVPLIFFSVSSAVAKLGNTKEVGKMLTKTLLTFLFTGFIAAIFMLLVVSFVPPIENIPVLISGATNITKQNDLTWYSHISDFLTASDFSTLFSHRNLLPLIVFSILVGMSASASRKNTVYDFTQFLQAGETVFTKLMQYILYFAPLGFFAYFACLIAEFGPQFLSNYVRVTIIYYAFASIYFIFAFTCYAYLADKQSGIRLFWTNIWLPLITSIATCSSIASIPANLIASKKMQVSEKVAETVIPLGAVLHKDGSVLGAIIKIAFLYSIFHLDFSGVMVYSSALIMGLLVGIVMGAIPSGGTLGEMLILSWYGFPSEALILIVAISVIIDPLATMLNVTGDTVASMLIARWLRKEAQPAAQPGVLEQQKII